MRNLTRASVVLLALALFIAPAQSYADRGRHHDHGHYHHPGFGVHVSLLPRGYLTIRLGGGRYYYYDGVYYNRVERDYVIVAPPMGAVVSAIPEYYQTVVINGITYYAADGAYYVYTRHGYQVVPQPVVVAAQPAPMVVAQPTPTQITVVSSATDEMYTLNIPNDKGGYAAVTIKRSGNGFTGPQGEFYAEFPKVAQLKAMYAK